MLVDGKRMVNGGVGPGDAVDLNTIPTAAVERVEVLKDGGSAIYGADAIAGVRRTVIAAVARRRERRPDRPRVRVLDHVGDGLLRHSNHHGLDIRIHRPS